MSEHGTLQVTIYIRFKYPQSINVLRFLLRSHKMQNKLNSTLSLNFVICTVQQKNMFRNYRYILCSKLASQKKHDEWNERKRIIITRQVL